MTLPMPPAMIVLWDALVHQVWDREAPPEGFAAAARQGVSCKWSSVRATNAFGLYNLNLSYSNVKY